MMRRKYTKLEDNYSSDEENEMVSNLDTKIMSSMMYLERIRNGYVEMMLRLAAHVIQLNDGNVFSFKKASSASN